MDGRKKINVVLSFACALLLLCCWCMYTDTFQLLLGCQKDVLTVGVFSDSYWEVQNGYSYQILEDAIGLFEEQHPGVQVEYASGILKEDYSSWLAEQLLADTLPDVFFVLPEDFNNFAELGALMDLEPFISKDAEFHRERFFASAYEYGQYNGMQRSLPYECAPKLMFINKTILDKEGIAIPEEDWTWSEFYHICEKVTKDTDGNGTIDQFGVVGYTWEEAFESNGVQLFNQQGTECCLADERVEPALAFIEKLETLNDGYTAAYNDFDLGKVVFQPMSFSEYRAYKPYPLNIKKYTSFEWGCIPMPAGPDGGNNSTLDTLLLAMNEKTLHSEYAWDFMKLLTCDPQIQAEIFDYSEGVSVLKEVTESDETLQRLIESSGDSNILNLEILSNAVEHAVTVPRFRNYDRALEEVSKAVGDIIDSDSNIHMAQIIWNRRINQSLEN
ncbi:MAG: extracellular solute-binding protein [Lachnospiraceae bacterium]|nr:extracellular solute-binding protein [Lachnospiraceae bacterium]